MNRLRVLLAALLCLVSAGCGESEPFPEGSTMDRIRDRGVLVVGIKFDQPLFGYKDRGGRITGFDAEIARLVARDLTGSERNIRFVETVSRERENFIAQQVVDLVIATYSITPARAQQVTFTDPYYYAGQDLLVRAADTRITGVRDLGGKTVCTAKGSTSVDRLSKEVAGVDLEVVDAYSVCVPALLRGRVDAISTDDTILLGLQAQHPEAKALRLVGEPFGREPYGMGIRKGDTVFRDYLNGLIARWLRDGEWDRAYRDTIGLNGNDVRAAQARP
ncbi:glutamate ABC transporter substrate-binding protein [Nonomuraea sp. SYSU D8015]|uniref:glutamate ABC transporter substrate-binding protein n=1 Tax=Nonomuraea sp. SYSU D8015 TaxID=2593644 RepID=UPI001CB7542C|nr:glutamate ABC transporter substrate-binding protein [Nonomuraea sp. SYSU D8015]